MNVKTPLEDQFTLKMTAWDRDLLKSNDLICGWELDISKLVENAKLTNMPQHLNKKYYEGIIKDGMKNADGEDPLTFVTSDKEGTPDSTIILKTRSTTFPDHKKDIFLYMDLRVVPKEYAE